MFDTVRARLHPAWSRRPLRTAARVIGTLVRRWHPRLSAPVVSFDEGRSRVVAELRTSLGLGLYRYGGVDADADADLRLVGKLLQPGDGFVDGGANIGLFSLVAAARVGASGRVWAFEPAAATGARLRRNLGVNRYPWVELRDEALGERDGQVEFVEFGGNRSGVSSVAPETPGGGVKRVVKLRALDEALSAEESAHLRLIKLDLEGSEAKALRGARRILATLGPDLLLEIERPHLARQGSTPEEIFEYLASLGYRAYRAARDASGVEGLRAFDETSSSKFASPNVFFSRDEGRLRRLGIRLFAGRGQA